MIASSYILRNYLKSKFNYTYRHFAEPIFEALRFLYTELERSKKEKIDYKKHLRIYRYVLFSLILSPVTWLVILLIYDITLNK